MFQYNETSSPTATYLIANCFSWNGFGEIVVSFAGTHFVMPVYYAAVLLRGGGRRRPQWRSPFIQASFERTTCTVLNRSENVCFHCPQRCNGVVRHSEFNLSCFTTKRCKEKLTFSYLSKMLSVRTRVDKNLSDQIVFIFFEMAPHFPPSWLEVKPHRSIGAESTPFPLSTFLSVYFSLYFSRWLRQSVHTKRIKCTHILQRHCHGI